jgi:flagellar basal body-associated protein FliL
MSAPKKDSAPAAAPAEGAAAAPAKKKLPIKTIGIVAGIMIAEAVAVFMIFNMIAPKKSSAHEDAAHVESSDAETIKEIQVVDEKFQNLASGRAFIWDTVVTVQVKKKHADSVEATLKSRAAELRQEMGRIVANADDAQLKEPNRETLLRQFTALLNKVVGEDEKSSDPLIERVLIPRLRGFPAEF